MMRQAAGRAQRLQGQLEAKRPEQTQLWRADEQPSGSKLPRLYALIPCGYVLLLDLTSVIPLAYIFLASCHGLNPL